jgi:hypothetical protein
LSLIAETSISVGFDSAELLFLLDSYFKSGNVGGGLRLAADFSGSHYLLSLDLSVSGGVSFIRATAMPLPYLHMGGTFPVFLPVTGGVFIRFYPDDIDYSWYVGVKFRLP